MDPLQIPVRSMGSVTIDLDGSFFIQLVIFLVAMAVLRKLVFEPYLAALDARESKTVRTSEAAAELQARADALSAQYEADLAAAREKATEARKTLRSQGLEQRETLLTEARGVSSAKMAAAQAAIDAQYDGARVELSKQVDELATMIADRVLGTG